MKRSFAATVWREGAWYVSQCLEVDVASQGESEEEALANLKEALELHFEGMAEDGDPIPRAGGVDSYRELIDELDVAQYVLGHVQIDTSRFRVLAAQA